MKKLLALLLILSLPSMASANLKFGAGTDTRLTIGTGAAITDIQSESTVLIWFYPTSDTSNSSIFSGRVSAALNSANWSLRTTGTLGWSFRLSKATTAVRYDTNSIDIALNQWNFVAVTHSEAAANTHIYHGTLNSLAVESTYGTATAGTGAVTADGGTDPAAWGNRINAGTWTGPSYPGELGVGAVVNRAMSLGEIRAWQFRPSVVSGTRNFMRFGATGSAGTQPDFSGKHNDGIPTGAPAPSFSSRYLPIRVFGR